MKKITQFKKSFFKTILVASTLFGASCSNNQKPEEIQIVTNENSEINMDSTNTKKEAQFLAKAAEINLEEIQLGQMAQQNSTRTDVKELGKMMEEEHTKCLNGLKVLANNKSITIPASLSDKAQNACKTLSNKSGADFDLTYCDMMVNGHRDAIAMFDKVSTESTDADIKEWAAATLPDLHRHLDHSISCQSKCKKITHSIY